jgi:putative peptidoglycan lipid II flippase
VLFNLTLIGGILLGEAMRTGPGDDRTAVIVQSASVALSGAVQLVYLWWCVRREDLRLTLRRPRMTADVRELGRLILPATFGAGVYQISQLIDTFFATRLPQGSLTLLSMADRLNQMPLGIVGIALGTAILPTLSRSIAMDDKAGASRIQSDAVELAMLLTLPAAAALWVCAPAFVTAFFVGGRFTAENGAITAQVVQALVAGLPAYVLVKILTPGYFARRDTRTPVYTAATALCFNVVLILLLIEPFGVVGLAAAGAGAAWLNTLLLYALLRRRDHFRLETSLIWRIGKQIIATAVMAGLLTWLVGRLDGMFAGNIFERAGALIAIVAGGGLAYFAAGFAVGAVDRDRIGRIVRRRKAS